MKHLKVTSSSPDFQAKVQEGAKGDFKIDVQPQDTKRPIATTLTIQPEDSQKIFYATARITNAPTAPAAPAAPARPPGQSPPGQTH